MAVDADAALPVGTDHDTARWYQDLFAPYFWSRLSGDIWSRLTGDFVSYLAQEWDMIISLLRPSGIAPGPVARPTSPFTLPASDNPARFVGLADALYADQSDSDALWRIGEVVRMPGSPRGTHPIARGVVVVQTVKSVRGVPTRVKSRIVVLGNLEQHNWSKSDCYAPVMPLYQVRLLVSLAVANRRVMMRQSWSSFR